MSTSSNAEHSEMATILPMLRSGPLLLLGEDGCPVDDGMSPVAVVFVAKARVLYTKLVAVSVVTVTGAIMTAVCVEITVGRDIKARIPVETPACILDAKTMLYFWGPYISCSKKGL